ncbi:MAG TPA: histidinol dehydrogenase, partial [Aurantimonas coralicida]|nr:histidinol dehydrogenase [Aurantimonas coralicida]
MPSRLTSTDADFEAKFRALLGAKRESAADVDDAVRAIIARVRAEGDAALIDLTRRFDGLDLTAETLRVESDEIDAAFAATAPETLAALRTAHERITSHHERQRPQDDRYVDALGVELGSRWTAVESVGLYVPGGQASYPSSVLMNAVPAKVAGVERIAMTVPAMRGALNPLVLAAAKICGIDEIYRLGGAQAVAAFA